MEPGSLELKPWKQKLKLRNQEPRNGKYGNRNLEAETMEPGTFKFKLWN